MTEEINKNQDSHLYTHGLPFSQSLASNIDSLYYRVYTNKKAALLIIDGGVGEGKTTLAVECADYLNKKHGQEEIDIKAQKQLGMGGTEFMKKIKICFKEGLVTAIYDEAGDFNKRGALTRFNAMLNRLFETYRAFKIIVILCLPNFNVLDKDIFDKNIPRLLLHLHNRNNKQGNFSAYSLYRMLYIKEKMKKLVVQSFAYELVEPNFRGHFKDLSAKRSKELDIISTKGKIAELDTSQIKVEGLVSYKDIATRLVKSIRWVQRALNQELKIKHKRIINKAKYFDREVIDVLADHIEDVDQNRNYVVKSKQKKQVN